MDETARMFFDKVPVARELYYRQKLQELQRSRDMIVFLSYARKWAPSMQILVSEDLPLYSINLQTGPGKDLGDYFLNWVLGVSHRIQAELDDMVRLWPSLGDLHPIMAGYTGEKTGPQIAPEGP